MVRFGLSIYLMFVTLAGPLLCPCAAPRFFASSVPANSEAAPDAASSCPCCPKLPTATDDARRGDQQPAPAQAPCPCPSHGHRVVAFPPQRVQQAGVAPSDLHDGLQLAAMLPWVDFAHLSMVGKASAAAHTFPSPKDLLHVYCILRC